MLNRKEVLLETFKKGYTVLKDGTAKNPKGKIVKGCLMGDYLFLSFRIDNIRVKCAIHRLQAYQKYGDKIFHKDIQVRHFNSNSLDNSYDNILIGTPYQNSMDKAPEVRMRAALIAASFHRKYDKEAVKGYYKIHGFKATMDHFSITSKGTMSYIINH